MEITISWENGDHVAKFSDKKVVPAGTKIRLCCKAVRGVGRNTRGTLYGDIDSGQYCDFDEWTLFLVEIVQAGARIESIEKSTLF